MANEQSTITAETIVDAPLEKVWKAWTTPDDITQWNNASDEWYTPSADNNLTEGGEFIYRMEARDGSFAFDFSGTYKKIVEHELLEYILADDRKVSVAFEENEGKTKVTETFEPEEENPAEAQKQGWQAILDNFKKYVEGKAS
ncbi:SRPBCC domain-containing protein [Persicitalea jodogahamensis]|uniref:Activator of HSP90 ATPase n=1 Tax=Persicitalea jodogahamensis TaxID=402147 RepID=A0A8J3D524_9BACT|nr:SRPBCC domain-containing protein [Persicitalea jodogahamensis]GHB76518.1 activator of HSP90 ATPase [Persicitalea jodogahamensis]